MHPVLRQLFWVRLVLTVGDGSWAWAAARPGRERLALRPVPRLPPPPSLPSCASGAGTKPLLASSSVKYEGDTSTFFLGLRLLETQISNCLLEFSTGAFTGSHTQHAPNKPAPSSALHETSAGKCGPSRGSIPRIQGLAPGLGAFTLLGMCFCFSPFLLV